MKIDKQLHQQCIGQNEEQIKPGLHIPRTAAEAHADFRELLAPYSSRLDELPSVAAKTLQILSADVSRNRDGVVWIGMTGAGKSLVIPHVLNFFPTKL